MKTKLRSREKCPVHGSYFCCGRKAPTQLGRPSTKQRFNQAVTRIEDPHHPRGYREICNRAELRRRKHVKIVAQDRMCALCELAFDDYQAIDLEHIEPKGMGGARRDDHIDNLQAAHRLCNQEKGSRRL